MTDITYLGEHTWAGQLGHVLTIVSLVGAVLAAIGYFIGAQWRNVAWESLGRLAFRMHSVAVLGIVVVLFTMLFNHWFEYDYVWKHSNLQMPMKYIASCFWEGQEGSFLLWTFWHVVLGNILIWRWARKRRAFARSRVKPGMTTPGVTEPGVTATPMTWESPVMAVFALVQVFLAFMLLGIYVGEVRLGSSPFLLIRELPENIGLPWTAMPNYLQLIPQFADGRGLNPLLQNYWMVIHPPTLFLGFAATLVPFGFAIAGLWRNDRRGWIEPSLPWTFFGVMVLGTGILMGGAWAYESLSFGGFWAWDPVENASLVPWITLVSAGHLMLVNKRKETSLFTAFLLTLLTFILVLYSTFLTRSGVLGDTSVHSFTGDGMLPALVKFLLIFIALSVAMLLPRRDQRFFYLGVGAALMVIGIGLQVEVPAILLFGAISTGALVVAYRKGFSKHSEEEALRSREFWLFIAALVLLLSAVQITFSTSVPVFNLLLEPFGKAFAAIGERTGSTFFTELADAKLAPPGEAVAHYNKWQVPFAIIVAVILAFGQYLRWKSSDMKLFWRQLLRWVIFALAVTLLGCVALQYDLAPSRFPAEMGWRDLTEEQVRTRWSAWWTGHGRYILLFFATSFAVLSNVAYIGQVLKGRLKNAGPSIAHAGFALVLLGALVSTSRQEEVSRNTRGMDLRLLNEGFNNSEDILLYKGDTVRMGEHFVHYRSKRSDGPNVYYDMDYFAVEATTYQAGDTVRIGEMLFRARDTHQAGEHFLGDQPTHWEALENYPRRALWHAREWSNVRPGKAEFQLAPFIQINPRFGNVAEPSTKHWPGRDLYTHIRYADQAVSSDTADDAWMPDRLYDKMVGDSIVTPTALVIIDSVFTVRDSATKAMLGERYTVYTVKLRVRDLYRPDRWFEAYPLVIYADDRPVMGKSAELPALRVKYGLATVDGDPSAPLRVGLNVAESEFLVMQAILFPGINILWIGCVLLALGTGMAVWRRIKDGQRERPAKAAAER